MPWTVRAFRGIELGLFFLILACMMEGSNLLISIKTTEAVHEYTRPVEFDYVSWTMNAFLVKLGQVELDTPFYFPETTRHQLVVDYLKMMSNILSYENQLNTIYADPKVSDPLVETLEVRSELEQLYARQRLLAPMAESILQEQVSETLSSLDLTVGGQPLPPVLFHISPLPYDLIISPREKIQQDAAISLIPDLSVNQQVVLENQVETSLDVSSLVVPVGGIGSYPTMIMRTTDLSWLSDTIAHEWTHNWLTLQPLGLNYETSPELRTMNETTASISGHEISEMVINRYYPELTIKFGHQLASLTLSPANAVFDFNAEMHATRVEVDKLLEEGKISEAENYMEQRRLIFWQHGYVIRKLNQAYFAFYGAYAETPGGAAGEDPVGPAVRALRAQSANLTIFLKRIARMDSFQQLQDAVSP